MIDLTPTGVVANQVQVQVQVQSDPLRPSYLDYPFDVSSKGTPALTTSDDHLSDLIVQCLFTDPGERINVPEFGVGVQRFVFQPVNDALLAAAEFLVSANLQRWLSDRITVNRVTVSSDAVTVGSEQDVADTVTILVEFTVVATQRRQQVEVQI